jgi:Splicing factor 3B subunit 1
MLVLQVPMTAEQYQMARWEREMDERNRPLTDEELDAIIPKEGYRIMPEPPVRDADHRALHMHHTGAYCVLSHVGLQHALHT